MSKVALCTVLAALSIPTAFAQDAGNPFLRGRYVAVPDRTQPEFDPEPVHAGAFDVSSSLGIGGEYNDNIYAEQTNATEDVILTINPHLDAYSTWSTHGLGAGFDVNHREYSDQGGESSTDYTGYISGHLDATRNARLDGRVYGGSISEKRYAPSSPNNAAEPTQYDQVGVEGSGTVRRDRIQLRATAGTFSNDFDTVALIPDPTNPLAPTTLNQDYRDMSETFFSSRVSYAVSPDFAVYVQGRVAEIDYDLATDQFGRNLDATRLNGQVGASFELAAPFRGDIAVGYISENKYDSSLENTDGLSVDGNLMWFPTQLTTVTFSGLRTIYDPGIIGSSSAILTDFGGRIDHELRRNIVAFGEANMYSTDFKGTLLGSAIPLDRTDDGFDVGAGLGYKLNKRARVDVGYTFRSQDSSGIHADRDFDQNIVTAELRIFP